MKLSPIAAAKALFLLRTARPLQFVRFLQKRGRMPLPVRRWSSQSALRKFRIELFSKAFAQPLQIFAQMPPAILSVHRIARMFQILSMKRKQKLSSIKKDIFSIIVYVLRFLLFFTAGTPSDAPPFPLPRIFFTISNTKSLSSILSNFANTM